MIGVLLGFAQAAAPPALRAALPSPISHYISPDDYPAAAIPSKAAGTVDLALGVGLDGRLTSCSIRKSSGWPILDAATCRILQRRLKFIPARTMMGQPTTDVIETSIEWHLPPPELPRHMQSRPN